MPYKKEAHTKESNKSIVNTSAYLVLAILLFSIISVIDFQSVYGQVSQYTGFDHDLIEVGYSNGKLWALGRNGTTGSTANNWLYEVNATSGNIDALHNVTSQTGLQAKDMSCTPEFCFISETDGTTSSITKIATVDSGGDSKGDVLDSLSNWTIESNQIIPIDTRFANGNNQVFMISKTSSNTVFAQWIDGDTMTSIQSVSSTDTIWGINSRLPSDIMFFNPTFDSFNAIFSATSTGSTTSAVTTGLWNLNSNSLDCFERTVDISGGQHTKFISYYGIINGTGGHNLGHSHGNGIDEQGFIPQTAKDGTIVLIDNSCDATDGIESGGFETTAGYDVITNSDTGLSTSMIRSGLYSELLEKLIVQETGGSARIGVMDFDPVSGNVTAIEGGVIFFTDPSSSQNASFGQMILVPELNKVFLPETGAGRAIVVLDTSDLAVEDEDDPFSEGGVGGQGTAPVFPENTVTDLSGLMLCLGGVIDSSQCDSETGLPTDTDPTTNGTGIMMLLFSIILSYAVLVSIHYGVKEDKASQGVHIVEVMNIHPVLLVMMIVANFTLAWHMGWIDDLIFYTMIVIVIGLAGFGLYRQVKT